jgi:iron(III) transport system permease protein
MTPAARIARRAWADPQRLVLGLGVAALLLFVAYPLLWLVLGAFGLPRGFGLQGFVRSFTRAANVMPMVNTVVLALAVGACSLLVAVPLAFAVARTDVAFRRVVNALVGLAYVLPPYLTAVAYIILLGPNAGHINRALAWAGLSGFNIFTGYGVIFVITLHVFAIPYFLTCEALASVDGAMEEAARMLGGGRWAVLRRVTLPLVAPAITGGGLLAGVASLALFGPQAILGLPAQIVYLPTRIFGAISSYPPRYPEASAMSLALVALTVAGLAAQRHYLGRRSYVTVGGKGVRPARWKLGAGRWPLGLLLLAPVLLAAVAPVAVLALAAVSKVWTQAPTLDNLTLAHFHAALLDNQIAGRGLANSLKLAVTAASLAVLVGLAVAYLDLRTKLRGRVALDYLAILPLGLPGTVMAVALLQAFIHPPLVLYGTIWILLVAYVARAIPLAARSANAALRQVDASLEEAARITGAGWGAALRRVLLPILQPSLLLAWLLVFIPSLSELSTTILLYSSGTETISVAIYRLNDMGQLEVVCALAVVLIGIILVALLLMQALSAKSRASLGTPSATG